MFLPSREKMSCWPRAWMYSFQKEPAFSIPVHASDCYNEGTDVNPHLLNNLMFLILLSSLLFNIVFSSILVIWKSSITRIQRISHILCYDGEVFNQINSYGLFIIHIPVHTSYSVPQLCHPLTYTSMYTCTHGTNENPIPHWLLLQLLFSLVFRAHWRRWCKNMNAPKRHIDIASMSVCLYM